MTQPIASYVVDTSDADQTRAFGEDLGRILAAGDLLMLSGGLGAGKTTLTQGIGVGMGVRGRVASPTFIVARVHPSLSGGPDLIHADAYRITDLNDLETLDLDSSLDEAVTVVEWGEGKTEAMSDERLSIEVRRASGGEAAHDGAPREGRRSATGTSSTWRIWMTAHASSSCTPTGTAGTASLTASSPPTAEPASTRLTPTSRITPCER